MITIHALSILSATFRFCFALKGLYFPVLGATATRSKSSRYSATGSKTTGRPSGADMSSSSESPSPPRQKRPFTRSKFVVAPYYTEGPGTLVSFQGGGRQLENVAFKHHMRLDYTYLAVNGMLMAQWHEGDNVVCQVNVPHENYDEMETSSD